MIDVFGYRILEKIHESTKSSVYRAIKEEDQTPVILKTLNQDYPSAEATARLQKEFAISHALQIEGIIHAQALVPFQNNWVLVLEDIGGQSLRQYLSSHTIDCSLFLNLAIQLSQTLGALHNEQIIHKDLKPENLIILPQTGQIRITDFSLAAQKNYEVEKENTLPETWGGTPAYNSPEQTGRMNRAVDYRTDFYSIGVCFYEMLVGKLPFITENLTELIHAHLAKTPNAPRKENPNIPKMISDIIMILLSKAAENRYHHAYGLQADFEECSLQWAANHTIKQFKLRKKDQAAKFEVSSKFYGRLSQRKKFKSAFERVFVGATEVVTISGPTGVGKSEFLERLRQSVRGSGGRFIYGRCDEIRQDRPYMPVIQAFQELIRKLLMESEEELVLWKQQLLEALGPNGQVMVEMIPEIKWIIGQQPAVETLPPVEAQNRFNLVFQRFVEVFLKFRNPLVLVLDDIHWADSATMAWVQQQATDPNSQHLLLVCAYPPKLSASHPWMLTLQAIQNSPTIVNEIVLQGLSHKDIEQLIRDTLHDDRKRIQALAKLVAKKTQSYPLFVKSFLNALYQAQLLTFDFKKGAWQWQIAKIKKQGAADNVVEMMIRRIQVLPEVTQKMLEIAACIGNNFDLEILSKLSQYPPEEIAPFLWIAIQENLILQKETEETPASIYQFTHTRIRQAAYFLISDTNKAALHLQIGRLLLQQEDPTSPEFQIFAVVNQLNAGRKLIDDGEECIQLAQMNLVAGRKSKCSNAYEHSLHYFKTGIGVLPPDCWNLCYELAFNLYLECSESEYINGHFEAAEQLFEVILTHAKTAHEKAKVFILKVLLYTSLGQYHQAIEAGQQGLDLFGVCLPRDMCLQQIKKEMIQLKDELHTQGMDHLRHLPLMKDLNQLAISEILMRISPALYAIGANLTFNAVSLTLVRMNLKYGNAPASVIAYSTTGMLLGGLLTDFQSVHEFAKLTLDLTKQFNNLYFKCQGYYAYGVSLSWTHHLTKSFFYLRKAFQYGIESGDLLFASYAISSLVGYMFLADLTLEEIQTETQKALEFHQRIKDRKMLIFLTVLQQAVLELQTFAMQPHSSKPSEDELLFEDIKNDGNIVKLSWCYAIQMGNAYLLDNRVESLRIIQEMEPFLKQGVFGIHLIEFYFYKALVLASDYSERCTEEQARVWEELEECQATIKTWAEQCPKNYAHKFLLIAAEMARLQRNGYQALQFYEKALEAAQNNHFIKHVALIHELMAKFHIKQGFERYVKLHLREAHYAYQQWGALAKVALLREQYASFFTPSPSIPSTSDTATSSRSSSERHLTLEIDFGNVMKASHAISQEIVLNQLLNKLLTILIENSGAEKGALVLERDGQFFVEAHYSVNQSEVEMSESILLEHPEISGDIPPFPIKMIQYVAWAQESIILADATKEGLFTRIPYVLKHKTKSVLCTPILHQSRLIGVIYLENNLTQGAFTPERLEVIELLSAQAAISLENARLYEAYGRFVPHTFLSLLEKENILEVKLGDHTQMHASILFSDIRNFTEISEGMSLKENFRFLNSYLKYMGPIIRKYKGFIDKYIGDAIMALFDQTADDAVQAGIAMLRKLRQYNKFRKKLGYAPLQVGLGINTGIAMLGTVGEHNRMEGTVISDAVNLASRVEGMTKIYGVPFLISESTFSKLKDPTRYSIRFIDRVKVKGKSKAVKIYEVFDADLPPIRKKKIATMESFETGWSYYQQKEFYKAQHCFQECLKDCPQDATSQIYIERCSYFLKIGVEDDWNGVTHLESK